ncbi:hypothetical protein DDZ15_10730 [Rhodohalobacter mucosus]|uniref:Uncharacterized protein n=1 Tax=Rhodohalobacter mucosus TaxID=2079485 RepID=A0A316TRP8_9BACT|nr:hypothetical protein DDZ15_10730 [Rhodohalobacter mucosus]
MRVNGRYDLSIQAVSLLELSFFERHYQVMNGSRNRCPDEFFEPKGNGEEKTVSAAKKHLLLS